MKKRYFLSIATLPLVLVTIFTSCKREHNQKPGKGDSSVVKNPCVQGAPVLVWVEPISGLETYPSDVMFDAAKHVVVRGAFGGVVDFDPGTAVFNLNAADHPGVNYLQTLDTAGKFVAAGFAPVVTEPPLPTGAITRVKDAAGNFYTLGTVEGTYDFDPGSGVANLTYHGAEDDDYYVTSAYYIQKLDAAGNFKWAILDGAVSNKDDLASTIVVDDQQNVYTGGFAPDLSSTWYLLEKFDKDGHLVWRKDTEGHNDHGMLLDSKGGIYTLGRGEKALVKYANTGDLLSTTPIGAPGLVYTLNIKKDAFDNVYIGGGIGGDFFVEKNDPSNHVAWVIKGTGTPTATNPLASTNILTAVAVDDKGENVYVLGEFRGTVNFGQGTDVHNVTTPSPKEFLAKYSQCH